MIAPVKLQLIHPSSHTVTFLCICNENTRSAQQMSSTRYILLRIIILLNISSMSWVKVCTGWPTPSHFPLPQPLAASLLLSGSVSVTFLDPTSREWDRSVCVFLSNYFSLCGIVQVLSCCHKWQDCLLLVAEEYFIVWYIHHIFLIHSSLSGHVGCFHILVIVNNAAVNMQVSLGDKISFPLYIYPEF